MDLCITAEEPFAYEPPKTKPFAPVSPPLTRAETRNTSTSGSSRSPAPLPTPTEASDLEFELIVHDPANDSALTYPWDLPQTSLRIPLDTSRVHLLNLCESGFQCLNLKTPSLVALDRSAALN